MPETTSYLVSPDDEKRLLATSVIINQLLIGCTEEVFLSLRCPVCAGALTLIVHSRLHAFCVRCTSSASHVCRHERTSEAPDWWRSHITGDWPDWMER